MENGGAFLRKSRKRFDGEVYEYSALCQTVRTERGPRQQVVATLGKFTEKDLAAGWRGRLEAQRMSALFWLLPPGRYQKHLSGS